ncbi:hypothetical protein JYB64_05835 [Algoriphagus aestuarii]|nr:hypothetical protein [Algoriphagus aestuarii]
MKIIQVLPVKVLSKILICLFLLCISVSTVLSQQTVPYLNLELQNGDLIFVGAEKENLSGAINRVTQKTELVSFDHVGMIEIHQDSLFIIHASTRKGSVREPLDSLVFRNNLTPEKFAIYRLKKDYQHSINQAIKESKSLLGRPYNWSYVLNDSSLYCSDFVERAFRHAAIFQLEPMTFINPETGKTDAFWVEFYSKQGMEVPEGKLGCNPNGLAASGKLEFIGYLNLLNQ